MYVSFYWTALYDFGQISPALSDNQTAPIAASNIFVNSSLFEIYASYLNNTIAPLLAVPLSDWTPDPYDVAGLTNATIQEVDTTFIRSYSCLERKIKAPISLIVQVITADYAFIALPYGFIISIAVLFEKRRRRDCKFPFIQYPNSRELLRRVCRTRGQQNGNGRDTPQRGLRRATRGIIINNIY
jgi:hypothetical protein